MEDLSSSAQAVPALAELNPEAGQHDITSDPHELAAALRAGERSWSAWPYYAYAARYGARGKRFTYSDSAWLVTLSQLEPAAALRQITWLGRVLAARGMPQLLLEQHLEHLHAELVSALPAQAPDYAVLQTCVAALRALRLPHYTDQRLAGFAQRFAQQVGHEAQQVPGWGALVAAAVADERAGIGAAVRALLDWGTVAERFSTQWIAATHATLAAAWRLAT